LPRAHERRPPLTSPPPRCASRFTSLPQAHKQRTHTSNITHQMHHACTPCPTTKTEEGGFTRDLVPRGRVLSRVSGATLLYSGRPVRPRSSVVMQAQKRERARERGGAGWSNRPEERAARRAPLTRPKLITAQERLPYAQKRTRPGRPQSAQKSAKKRSRPRRLGRGPVVLKRIPRWFALLKLCLRWFALAA
jgi:hypothetical protein